MERAENDPTGKSVKNGPEANPYRAANATTFFSAVDVYHNASVSMALSNVLTDIVLNLPNRSAT